MGIEPMTPVLPRLCATSAPHGQVVRQSVGSEGFEPPKSETADLQSAPFDRFGNCPGRESPIIDGETQCSCYFRHKERTLMPPE